MTVSYRAVQVNNDNIVNPLVIINTKQIGTGNIFAELTRIGENAEIGSNNTIETGAGVHLRTNIEVIEGKIGMLELNVKEMDAQLVPSV